MLEFKPINAETIIKTSEYLKYKISRTSDYYWCYVYVA